MDNPSIKYGVYVGVGAAVLSLLFYFINPELLMDPKVGIPILIAIIYFMTRAVNEVRDENEEGLISFKEAFKASWLTFIVSFVISNFVNYFIFNFLDPSLIDMAKEVSIEMIEGMGGFLGEEGLEKAISEIEDKNPYSISSTLLNTLIAFVFPGALIALIIAAVKKRVPSPFA